MERVMGITMEVVAPVGMAMPTMSRTITALNMVERGTALATLELVMEITMGTVALAPVVRRVPVEMLLALVVLVAAVAGTGMDLGMAMLETEMEMDKGTVMLAVGMGMDLEMVMLGKETETEMAILAVEMEMGLEMVTLVTEMGTALGTEIEKASGSIAGDIHWRR